MAVDTPLVATWDWATEPYILRIERVAAILDRSVTTIRRELRAGCMVPAPMPKVGKTTPYQWSREIVRAYVEGGYRKHDPIGARRLRRGLRAAS